MINQKLSLKVAATTLLLVALINPANAQSVEQIRWKSEAQVREILGEPQSVTSPVGTHASYTLWKYEDFTVAFANQKAFHLFNKNSLRKLDLEQDQPES